MFLKYKVVRSIFVNETILNFEVFSKLVVITNIFAPDIYIYLTVQHIFYYLFTFQ
jgi:hypothetical protein